MFLNFSRDSQNLSSYSNPLFVTDFTVTVNDKLLDTRKRLTIIWQWQENMIALRMKELRQLGGIR